MPESEAEGLTLFLIIGSAPFCMRILVSFRRPMAALMWRGVSLFYRGACVCVCFWLVFWFGLSVIDDCRGWAWPTEPALVGPKRTDCCITIIVIVRLSLN